MSDQPGVASRHELLSIVAARGQAVCVAYVNGSDLGPRIEELFTALSRLQVFDDAHEEPSDSVPLLRREEG